MQAALHPAWTYLLQFRYHQEILKETLNYCKKLLEKNKPTKDYYEDFVSKENLHKKRMEKNDEKGESEEFTNKMFDKAINEMSKKKSEKYRFILKSGNSYKNALVKLFKSVWSTEEKPESWRKTTILQVPKGKSDQGNLNKMRNIHLKDPIPKLFCHIVMNQVKGKIMKNMSKFQLGTKVGHRPQEHIFVLKSIMSLHEYYNEGLLLNLYDICKFFDKEELTDVLDEAHSLGLKEKPYRLVYELNKNTVIKVRTALGDTEEEELEPCLGQGGVESGILSAGSLDQGLQRFFQDLKMHRIAIKEWKPL